MLIGMFLKIRDMIAKHPRWKRVLYPVYRGISLLYGSQIPIECRIGKNVAFKHGLYGIFISGGSVIGENVTFYHHITLGGVYTPNAKKRGAPRIGNGCVLYPGCKVLGGVTIGENCVIGPNVVVWYDVEDNTTVLYEKSSFRLIHKEA